MAFCPKCQHAMDTMGSVCPHCGYDFPMEGVDPSIRREGFAYSKAADVALLGGTVRPWPPTAGTPLPPLVRPLPMASASSAGGR